MIWLENPTALIKMNSTLAMEMTIKNVPFSFLQVTAVCHDRRCRSQWDAIGFAKTLPFRAWKRFLKKPDDKQVPFYRSINTRKKIMFKIDSLLFASISDNGDLPDYYFRDSFEHSSSESGYTTNYDALRMGPNRLHQNHSTTDNFTFHMHQSHNNNTSSSTAMANQQNAINSAKNMKKFSILHAFIPSFIFVIVVLVIATVFILESESDNFVTFKNLPEMMSLNYQYYQPFKDFLLRRLGLKSWIPFWLRIRQKRMEIGFGFDFLPNGDEIHFIIFTSNQISSTLSTDQNIHSFSTDLKKSRRFSLYFHSHCFRRTKIYAFAFIS